jgi:hypothetical protein
LEANQGNVAGRYAAKKRENLGFVAADITADAIRIEVNCWKIAAPTKKAL